ncbi:MAG: methyltransferase domain-containing protein [Anaerolineaceae bacterium]|nr:methyltransferase domain-containing protein [Anaerolineaceae bacterium]
MNPWVGLFLVALTGGAIAVLGWWLLIATEGVYLGRRVVVLLYDLYARRYDKIKDYYREYEQRYLAQPIMEKIAPHQSPLVLDVATGTGRLPLALMRHERFQGRVVAVDLSRQMLSQGVKNLYVFDDRVTFIWSPAEDLPFPDDSFDVVTCLEALEFMVNSQAVLCELVRVLRPGGLLLITQRINTKLMPGKTWTGGQTLAALEKCGITDANAQIWQVDYRKVWGRKAGDAPAVGSRPLAETLRCPACQESLMVEQDGRWHCPHCAKEAAVGDDGVIELFPLYR